MRPTLGCRLMAGRVFFRLKEAVGRDLQDWLPETRIKASQLLYQASDVVRTYTHFHCGYTYLKNIL